MSKPTMLRNNFFNGQRVSEKDLTDEQTYNRELSSSVASQVIGTGVVYQKTNILFDSREPIESQTVISSGSYDGKILKTDLDCLDTIYGSQLSLQVVGSDVRGEPIKILIVGLVYDSLNSDRIDYEIINIYNDNKVLTKRFYKKIISFSMNNYSSNSGLSVNASGVTTKNFSNANSYIIIRESESLEVFSQNIIEEQTYSPNIELNNFVFDSQYSDINDFLSECVGSEYNPNDLLVDTVGNGKAIFEKSGSTSVMYGQKFLAKSNNIQKIEFLLSVDEDTSQPSGEEFNYSGDIVVSIVKLSSDLKYNEVIPDFPIDFPPEISSIAEISLGKDDIEATGVVLNDSPQIVSFNFSSSLISDPAISPDLEVGNYYAILVSRRGSTSVGTINLHIGYDEKTIRKDSGCPVSAELEYGTQTTRFIEWDSSTRTWVDHSDKSLWFKIFSSIIEVTAGSAYNSSHLPITLPKAIPFIGEALISKRNIFDLVSVSSKNYILIDSKSEYSNPLPHPRTGEVVNTRVSDSANIIVETSISDPETLNIIGAVTDLNKRSFSDVTGTVHTSLIGRDNVILLNPSSSLSTNLIGLLFQPHTGSLKYRITKTENITYTTGDINGDGVIDSSDISELLNYIGTTLNSEVILKRISFNNFDYIKFLLSDLNGDGSVDGIDLEYLESATKGVFEFSADKTIPALKVYLESLTPQDRATLVATSDGSGYTESGISKINFTIDSTDSFKFISVGDEVTVSDATISDRLFYITSKTIDEGTLLVTLSVTDEDGVSFEFEDLSGFDVIIKSFTSTNILNENKTFLDLPISDKSFTFEFGDSWKEWNSEVLDLRRIIPYVKVEQQDLSCICDEENIDNKLSNINVFDKIAVNEVLDQNGNAYHGDFEFVNINFPLPPGTISDCSFNIYEAFVKSYNGTCYTAAGYPALKYSDGSYVGCDDTSSSTDITKGKVKFTSGIASLHVDGLVDGYAIDGYADATSTTYSYSAIQNESEHIEYNSFSTWTEDPDNAPIISVGHPSGPNNPAIFILTTSHVEGLRYGSLICPDTISGDFQIDFSSGRMTWESEESEGIISSFCQVRIDNSSGYSISKLGWRQNGTTATKLFFSIKNYNSSDVITSSYDYTTTVPDTIGDDILFRIRRIDDALFAYYINPSRIMDGSTYENFGQYIRLGENPDIQPGTGDATISIGIQQISNPIPSLTYKVNFKNFDIYHNYSSAKSTTDLVIGQKDSKDNRVDIVLPIEVSGRISLVSATLKMTCAEAITSSDTFYIKPYETINAKSMSAYTNIPLTQDASYIIEFSPGTLAIEDVLEVNIDSIATKFLSDYGFLPGAYKAISIYSDSSYMKIQNELTLEIAYEDVSTGVVFKVGFSIDAATGIATLRTKNVLYDSLYEQNRTVINIGVYLKKSGFKNRDLKLNINDLRKVGIGTCTDENYTAIENGDCYFVVGSSGVGTFVEGPFDCNFNRTE